MKLSELIAYADAVKPNAFNAATKTIWVNEIEGMIQTDVMMLAHDEMIAYSAEEDVTLLVEPPHDKLYRSYVCAMIDFANGEYDRYASSMQMFNKQLSEYIGWYARIYRPADGQCEWKGYYISAYGIAVKHGYAGTEEDWLLSLRGETGPEGTGLEIVGLIASAEELAEVTDPETGDCYAVGTAESNTVYVWDGAAWHDIGPVKGDKGDKGDTGNTGPAGAKGDKGDRGLQGIQGPAGAAGPTGPQGSQGIQGIQGVQGQTGAQGPKGDKGEPGDRGLQGDRGPAGAAGPKGDKGDTGNISYAVFEIDTDDGYLYVTYPDNYTGPEFAIADGILEVTA